MATDLQTWKVGMDCTLLPGSDFRARGAGGGPADLDAASLGNFRQRVNIDSVKLELVTVGLGVCLELG